MDIRTETIISYQIADTLETAMYSRHIESGMHNHRTTALTGILVRKMLEKPKYRDLLVSEDYDMLIKASSLHDIGKIGIKDTVLLKPGQFNESEYEDMKQHVLIGKEIIDKAFQNIDQDSVFLKHCRDICLYHHEQWDGAGYLKGLKGEEIPLSARIVSIIDVYEALTGKRCYKETFTHEQAMETIMNQTGKKFDPDIIDCFYEISEDICTLT